MTSTAARIMGGLKQFQRDTVTHITHQFYGTDGGPAPGSSGRFLVADETGLGKSVVARGVIAHTLEVLQQRRPDRPVNVVYICSNQDLAKQNLGRLNVSDDPYAEINTRLSMLATQGAALRRGRELGGGDLNLISFTPGTSFSEGGMRLGSAAERALIALLLERMLEPGEADWERTLRLLRGWVRSVGRFHDRQIAHARKIVETRGLDPEIEASFRASVRDSGAIDRFMRLAGRLDADTGADVPASMWNAVQNSVAELRNTLAQAGVETLQPDLVILDEFQRFRHLLDSERTSDAAELAQHLFGHEQARVLLLSATPYKPFTRGGDADGDHYQDFLAVVRFLAGGVRGAEAPAQRALEHYRSTLTRGGDAAAAAAGVRDALLPLMTRAERPEVVRGESLVQDRPLPVRSPTAADLQGWVGLRRLADAVGSPLELDRWKSVPYFASYMDGYKLGADVQDRLHSGEASVTKLLSTTQALPAEAAEPGVRIDAGNAKLRALIGETLERGWWRAIWMPPSMPYIEPGPSYAPLHEQGMTKHVVFSAWSAVPTAVASLMSHEAMRLRMTRTDGHAAADESELHQLEYRMGPTGAPAAMSTLTLFWPHPALADLGDPLQAARDRGSRVAAHTLLEGVREKLPGQQSREAWTAYFGTPGGTPTGFRDTQHLVRSMGDQRPKWGSAQQRHLTVALRASRDAAHADVTHPMLPALAAFSPGNSAFRALRSIAGPRVTEAELWSAAYVLASGLRSIFNRGETIMLLNTLDDFAGAEERPYWHKVLDYCADGNLQAVLDEYAFQLHRERGGRELNGDALMEIAVQITGVLGIQRVNYRARGVDPDRTPIDIGARWALRYGDANVRMTSESGEKRQASVRAAFNSPFAPFVLTSTSAGQEGIDFHWWSHAVVHWNLPSNPVDFEQREGRVNRFAGHAIRKNVAEQHWADVLASTERSAWEAAFDAATDASAGMGDFAPWWVYPGSSRIHRVLTNFPLSVDEPRYARLKRDLVLYRLTLGQPRQEDMLELLAARGDGARDLPPIDLRAPSNG